MTLGPIDATTAQWVQPPGFRLAGWVVGACSLGLTLWSVIVSGRDGLESLVFTGPFLAAAIAAVRQRVAVDATEIVICNGLWTRHIRRTEILRLQWLTSAQVGWPSVLVRDPGFGKLYVVATSGRPVGVPATEVRNVERPRRSGASMAAWLSAAAGVPIGAGAVPEVDEWDWD